MTTARHKVHTTHLICSTNQQNLSGAPLNRGGRRRRRRRRERERERERERFEFKRKKVSMSQIYPVPPPSLPLLFVS
jgi:hypothetical protein